jgi:cell division protein FtsL
VTAPAHATTRAASAAAVAPARAPKAAPRRPPLRVVAPGERAARDHRSRARLVAVSTVLLVAMALFGVVVAHVVLTQNQFRLEKLQRQAAEQQARYERLREQVAELESPARVVSAAQERLGMVAPPTVKYLTPTKAAAPAPAAGGSGSAASAKQDKEADDDEQAMTDWSVVKRELGSRP